MIIKFGNIIVTAAASKNPRLTFLNDAFPYVYRVGIKRCKIIEFRKNAI